MAFIKPIRTKQGTTPGHVKDIKIGICRGMGLSREDTAAAVGCSMPTVDLRKDEPVALEWEAWTRNAAVSFTTGVKERLEKQMEKRLGKAMDVIDRAVDDDDIRLALLGADRIMDRAVGKATQKVETTSDHTERVIFQLPSTTLEAIQAFAAATQPRRITGQVVEAETLDDNNEQTGDE